MNYLDFDVIIIFGIVAGTALGLFCRRDLIPLTVLIYWVICLGMWM
jgi:hypothetical protein